MVKKLVKKVVRNFFNEKACRYYKRSYRALLKHNQIPNKPCPNEEMWREKWGKLGRFNNAEYRLFSQYIGNNVNIIPEVLCKNLIEPILNPIRYRGCYTDKNFFDKLFEQGVLPRTLFRKMNGFYYNVGYDLILLHTTDQMQTILRNSGVSKIVVKPTIDTSSGNGVKLFGEYNGQWLDLDSGDTLTMEYLNNQYGDNFIVQECVEQHDSMSYYNSTSVNTLRLTVYRSVLTDACCIPNAYIRIGKNGALVDNAHAGGGFVGINSDGTLCNKVFDQYGGSTTMFNEIDFNKEHKILNWDKVVEFAKYIGKQIPHMRLLSLDIMIDKSGTPRLIEFNCNSYGVWAPQFTLGPAFGEYTDEIIEYCKKNKNKAVRHLIF